MNTTPRPLVSITRMLEESGREIAEVGFRGSVRGAEVDGFRDALEAAGDRASYLLVNLEDLEYLCSTGLGTLLAQSRRQEKRGGWLRIVAPSPTVRMILGLSGVSDILVSSDSARAALRDLPEAA